MKINQPPKWRNIQSFPSEFNHFMTIIMQWLYRLWDVEDWNEVATFTNSWANVGGVYYNAAYYKDTFGIVRFRGRIDSGTSGTSAFTLPEGYRPTATMIFSAADSGANATVTVNSSGNVIGVASGGSPVVSLETVSFRAEA